MVMVGQISPIPRLLSVCVCIYVCEYVYVCVYMCMYICVYVCIHDIYKQKDKERKLCYAEKVLKILK